MKVRVLSLAQYLLNKTVRQQEKNYTILLLYNFGKDDKSMKVRRETIVSSVGACESRRGLYSNA